MDCAYGDYSCEYYAADPADNSPEDAAEEVIDDDSWYANTTFVHFLYWMYGITHLGYFIFGVNLYIWYPNLIMTD